jgi:uncharacterized protein (DUF1499 family)
MAALALAVLCALAALLAGPAYRTGVLPLGAGLQTVRWAATVALVAAALGIVAIGLGLGSDSRRSFVAGLAALVVGLVVAGPPLLLWRTLDTLPHIHDVTTDTTNPPRFSAVLPLRKDARNPVDYAPQTAAQQRQGYPDIAPARLALDMPACFARAQKAAAAMGWDIVSASTHTLQIEATDTSLLFGFKDDVVIRVGPDAVGCRVDVRSLSRVGGFDFGVNAKRVRAYLARLNAG